MEPFEYMDDAAAAKVLGVAPVTVKRWRLSGLMEFHQRGPRRIGILPEHIKKFLEDSARRASETIAA